MPKFFCDSPLWPLEIEKTRSKIFLAKCRKGLVRAPAAVRGAAQTPCCSALEDMAMGTDFAPFSRSSIGVDRVFDLLDNATRVSSIDNFPPYDIAKTGDDAYRIQMAVAGYAPEELSITTEPNLLIVTGEKSTSTQ